MAMGAVATFVRYSPVLILVAAWEAVARSNLFSADVFPPVTAVTVSWLDLLASGELVANGAVSVNRALTGLLLAIACGTIIGIAMAVSRPVQIVLAPLLDVFYPIPKSALIPVTAIWLGFGDSSKILLVFLGCILPVALSAFNGIRGTDRALVWSARSMGANRLQVITDVMIPSALGEIMNGVRTALALSFILVVSSELLVAREGFGFLIGFLGGTGAYSAMFAIVLTVALLGFVADRIFLALSGRALRWQRL